MKDIPIGNGEVVTQAKFIELNARGCDTLTEFLATQADVRLLAEALAEEVVHMEFNMSLCCGRQEIDEYDYLVQRLLRVFDFVPEIEEEIRETLRVARLKSKIDLGDRSLPASPGCPKCFSPLDRQHAVLDNMHYTLRATAAGEWELGELQLLEPYMKFSTFRCTDCGNSYTSFHSRIAHEVAAWAAELQLDTGGS
jgi:hypothetical protein